MSLEKLYKEDPEEYVSRIFDLFELTDLVEKDMKRHKSIKPKLNWSTDKYVLNYYQNCPIFKELMKRDDEEALKILWKIKDFEAKLNRETMSEANALKTCKNCLLNNKKPACKTRCL